ncbi:MAG: copper chaperone PCu(A)C [Rhodobacteraceae bacterium]|nr:copper chaperone PCu(A)C [Paracoccaceae bacterium]
MSIRSLLLAAFASLAFVTPGFAGETIVIKDPYIRSSTPTSPSGGAFMVIMNHGDTQDRLIGGRSDIAKKIEIHTHIEGADGVMKMVEVEGGIVLEPGEMHGLERGGDHVMFMGLTQELKQGDTVSVTLIFEKAGEVTIELPVDRERKPSKNMHKHSDG